MTILDRANWWKLFKKHRGSSEKSLKYDKILKYFRILQNQIRNRCILDFMTMEKKLLEKRGRRRDMMCEAR